MPRKDRTQIIHGLRITSLGTLASRMLGMVRDMATAALFGLASEGVMDAFVVAFRIPNSFRRLFGEGALTASYLPVLTSRLDQDRKSAWQLASVTLTWLAMVLLTLMLLIQAACGLVAIIWADVPGVPLVAGLTATMMPYMVLICLTAQIAATLHALAHFAMPAFAPALLNICWLAAVWGIAPWWTSDQKLQVYILAVCIVIAGVLQLGIQLPPLWRLGFRFDYNWRDNRDVLYRVVRAFVPMTFGLAVTQVNTLVDVLLAWGLSTAPGAGEAIWWLGDAVNYPMQYGAAAAIYFGERLYQFPQGVLGVAVATVIFPALSLHAARGEFHQMGSILVLGLRLVWFLALPAGVGLILLADPIAHLLFQRGAFTVEDAERTARMIAYYGSGVWAYCALPVVIRGYYALGDGTTPVRVGLGIVGLNFILNLVLVWPLGEAGLALSTSITAGLQVGLLAVLFLRRHRTLMWRQLGHSMSISSIATLLMGLVGYGFLQLPSPADELARRLWLVSVPLAACVGSYLMIHWILGGKEFAILLGRRKEQ